VNNSCDARVSGREKKKKINETLTGRIMMCAGLIPLPSGPCFAIADIARIAIDDAVSNPGLVLSHSKLVGLNRFTKTEQQAYRVHLNVRSDLPLVPSRNQAHLPGVVYEGDNRSDQLHEQGVPVVVWS
jgi:hypothetical protein